MSFLNSTPNTGRFLESAAQSTGDKLYGQQSFAFGPSTKPFSFGGTGTTIKFQPLSGSDIELRNGLSWNLNTKYQCITCMKEYENKSFEELRHEDYEIMKGRPTNDTFGRNTCSLATLPSGFSISKAPTKLLFGAGATTIRKGRTTDTFGSCTTCSFGYHSAPTSGFTFGASATRTGTTLKFCPPCGSDTVLNCGVSCSIGTKYQSITCMIQYENKSFEELRYEDYAAGRKCRKTHNTCGRTILSSDGSTVPISEFIFVNSSEPLFGTSARTIRKARRSNNAFGRTTCSSIPVAPKSPSKSLQGTEATNSDAKGSQEDEQKLLKCIICLENERNVVFQPCNHFAVCLSCSHTSMSNCPVCRKRINDKLKVFVS